MTTRRNFLSMATGAAFAQPKRRPNIIWIMADDLGLGDLGCYGQKHIRTPNIDRLAADGIRYTRAYAGCTVCAPSRSVLMTGKHMGHTSVRSNPGAVPLLKEDVTVAEVLKSAGYRTGAFGKWGLGDLGSDGLPTRQGFDEFFGYLHQVHAHYFYPDHLIHNEQKVPLDGNRNGARAQYSHDEIAKRALDFIRRSAGDPFFCYIPFTIPHLELLVPDDSQAEYRSLPDEKPYVDPRRHYADQPYPRATYAAMVSRMDRDVGRVMSLLRELSIDSDTIVFFTSDNGGATALWNDPGDFFKNTAGLRGHKTNMYEGGIRTPLIARWPGRIRPATTSNHLCYFADFMPTAAELAGIKPPPGTDGISLMASLTGRRQRPHEYLYWELPLYDGKTGTFPKQTPMQALRWGRWKAIRPKPGAEVELYDLDADPVESKDMSREKPALRDRLEKMMAAVRTEPRPQRNP